jgi:hypothetical protein
MALQSDFNLRRLERYLAVAFESGAAAAVVLTKADLCEDLPEKLAEVTSVAVGADVLVTSGRDAATLEPLRRYVRPARASRSSARPAWASRRSSTRLRAKRSCAPATFAAAAIKGGIRPPA